MSDEEVTLTNPNGATPRFAALVLEGTALTIESWSATGKRRTSVKRYADPAKARHGFFMESTTRMRKGFVRLHGITGAGIEQARPGERVLECVPSQSPEDYVFDMSLDGATLATGTPDDKDGTGKLHLIDVATGRRTLVHTDPPDPVNSLGRRHTSVRFDGTGTRLVSTLGGDTRMLDLTTGESRVIASYNVFGSRLGRLRPSFDATRERLLVYDKKTMRILNGDEQVFELAVPDDAQPYSSALSPSGRLLAIGHRFGAIEVWNVDSGRRLHGEPFQIDGDVHRVGFDPADTRLLAAGYGRRPAVWCLADRRRLQSSGGESQLIPSWTYTPDGSVLAIHTMTVAFHDPQTLDPLPIERIAAGRTARVVFCADGSLMAVGGQRLSVYRTPTTPTGR